MKSMFCSFRYLKFISAILLTAAYLSGCSNKEEIGIGPIKDKLTLAAVDINLGQKGQQLFMTKCSSCHKFDSRFVGPPLKDVTKRRKPEWILNMMLNPVQMTQENNVAKELFTQYLIQMTFQDITQDDARNILEYFRAVDEGKLPGFN